MHSTLLIWLGMKHALYLTMAGFDFSSQRKSPRDSATDSPNKDQEVTQCHDCGELAPPTQSDHTLISSEHGWRLSFEKRDGRRHAIWRCPSCWQEFKKQRGVGTKKTGTGPTKTGTTGS